MTEINIDKLNLRELTELELRISLRKETIEEEEKNDFFDMMRKEAAQRGLNFETVMGGKIRKPRKKISPKYENPDFNPATDKPKDQFWTGVGRPAKWVTKYLESHSSIDDCLIDKSKATAEPAKDESSKPHDKQHKIKAV